MKTEKIFTSFKDSQTTEMDILEAYERQLRYLQRTDYLKPFLYNFFINIMERSIYSLQKIVAEYSGTAGLRAKTLLEQYIGLWESDFK